jgi:hypothetical protein
MILVLWPRSIYCILTTGMSFILKKNTGNMWEDNLQTHKHNSDKRYSAQEIHYSQDNGNMPGNTEGCN